MSKKTLADVDELHDKLTRVRHLLSAIDAAAMRGAEGADSEETFCEIMTFAELAKREAAI